MFWFDLVADVGATVSIQPVYNSQTFMDAITHNSNHLTKAVSGASKVTPYIVLYICCELCVFVNGSAQITYCCRY